MFFALFGTSLSFQGPFPLVVGESGFKVLGYALFLHLHIAASLLLFCSQGYARLCYCPLLFSFSGNERFGRFGCCCTFYKERRNAKICQTCRLWKARKMKDILQWDIFSYSEMRKIQTIFLNRSKHTCTQKTRV